jgi:hypothetical protein
MSSSLAKTLGMIAATVRINLEKLFTQRVAVLVAAFSEPLGKAFRMMAMAMRVLFEELLTERMSVLLAFGTDARTVSMPVARKCSMR